MWGGGGGRGGYSPDDFQACLKSWQIQHQTSTHYILKQNGKAETVNRTLVDRARAMVAHDGHSMSSHWSSSARAVERSVSLNEK